MVNAKPTDGMNFDRASMLASRTPSFSCTTPPRSSSAPSALVKVSPLGSMSADTERNGASCYPSPISPKKVAGLSRGGDISRGPATTKVEPPRAVEAISYNTHSTLSATPHPAYNTSNSSTQLDVTQHNFTGGLSSEVSFVQESLIHR
jgi:hypothetical protein